MAAAASAAASVTAGAAPQVTPAGSSISRGPSSGVRKRSSSVPGRSLGVGSGAGDSSRSSGSPGCVSRWVHVRSDLSTGVSRVVWPSRRPRSLGPPPAPLPALSQAELCAPRRPSDRQLRGDEVRVWDPRAHTRAPPGPLPWYVRRDTVRVAYRNPCLLAAMLLGNGSWLVPWSLILKITHVRKLNHSYVFKVTRCRHGSEVLSPGPASWQVAVRSFSWPARQSGPSLGGGGCC